MKAKKYIFVESNFSERIHSSETYKFLDKAND